MTSSRSQGKQQLSQPFGTGIQASPATLLTVRPLIVLAAAAQGAAGVVPLQGMPAGAPSSGRSQDRVYPVPTKDPLGIRSVSISWKFQKLSCAMRRRLGFAGNRTPVKGLTFVWAPSASRQKSTENR